MRVLWREHQHTAPTPFGPRSPPFGPRGPPFGPRSPRTGREAPRSGREPRPAGARRPARRGETAGPTGRDGPLAPPRRVPGAPHVQSNRRGRGRIFKDGRGRLGRPLPSLNLFTPLSASVRRTVRGTSSGEVPSASPRGASRGRGGEVDRTESMKSCHRSNGASVFPALDAGAIHSQTLRSKDTCPRVPPEGHRDDVRRSAGRPHIVPVVFREAVSPRRAGAPRPGRGAGASKDGGGHNKRRRRNRVPPRSTLDAWSRVIRNPVAKLPMRPGEL